MARRPQPELVETREAGQLAFDLGHIPSHAEDDFMVGEGNRLAYERIIAFAHWSEPLTLITGPAKAGKSHLARIFVDRSGAIIAQPETLRDLAAHGGMQPVVLEDVDRVDYPEEALFHFLNQSMREHRPLLMTAREAIEAWSYRTNDVRSRARRAVAFPVEMTDDIQLSQMLVKLFSDRQIAVDPRIIGYLVARMERSTEEAVALSELMDRMALARGTAITRRIAAEALERRRVDRGETSDYDPERDEE